MPSPLKIDVVSDIVCPWCLIGSRRLDQTLAAMPDAQATVSYLPFLLDPTTPAEGGDLRERLRAKFGRDPDGMFGQVESAARSSGIPLDFAKVRRYASTVGAHTLARHAIAKGTQRALVHALYDAYFLEGRDIGQPAVLAEIATAHGFESSEALHLVQDPKELAITRAEAEAIARQGVTGVPFFVFAEKYAVSGAQPVEALRKVIEKALG